jgi:hypothetical protein
MVHGRHQGSIPQPSASSWPDTDTDQVGTIRSRDLRTGPNQLYRIDKCLYGLLPDSGRHFYRHYRDALIEEGYIMSNMNNCLFYKITEKETTFIVLSNEESAYLKKCKHFIMVVNYVREQL